MKTNYLDGDRLQSNESGQYMVEFALSFTLFILFVFFVIDLGLLIYNHNLFYRAVSRGAREASLGASNQQITRSIGEFVSDRYFPGVFSVANPPEGVEIRPTNEIDRVDGTEVIVIMDARFGISIFQFLPLTVELPIRSRELIVQDNDRDRDGLKDRMETHPGDHDNNGNVDELRFDGPDGDADGDGENWSSDTVAIGYFQSGGVITCSGYAIYRPEAGGSRNNTCTFNPTKYGTGTWEQWFDGAYHAPEIWDDNSVALPKLFERQLPRWSVDNDPGLVRFTRILRTAYDADNDGWEDKYDDFPKDPFQH